MEEKNKGGRPPIFNTPDELQERIDEYKRYLETSGKPPTIAGLAYYTGIDRQHYTTISQRMSFLTL